MKKLSILRFCAVLLTLLVSTFSASAQEQSGNWSASGIYDYANGTRIDVTGTYSDGRFNSGVSDWVPSSLAGDRSLQRTHPFGSCETFSFTQGGQPKPQVNPTIHLDRVGGASGRTANSALVTLSGTDPVSGAALTWTELAGTSDFLTTATTAQDGDAGSRNSNNYSSESGAGSRDSTAAGSLRINGFVTSFQLCYPNVGPFTNIGDGIEYILFSDPANPALDIQKSTSDVPQIVGDTLDYSFVVTNTGNAFASSVVVTDPRCASGPTYISGDSNNDSNLDLSETWTYTCTSNPLTQPELTSGTITNTATVGWSDPVGNPMGTDSDTLNTPVVPNVIAADNDNLGSVNGLAGGTTTLEIFTGDTLDSAQIGAGDVQMTVVSSPTPAAGSVTLNPDGTVTVGPNTTDGTYTFTYQICETLNATNCATATATVVVLNQPHLTFDKQASTTDFTAVGDEIDYAFLVNNDGNVPLTNVAVTDTTLGFSCTIPTLAVGVTDNTTCVTTKVITQAEIDAGTFVNTASATADGGATGTDTETATGPTRAPAFTFLKSSADTFGAVGDVVNFSFSVTNTGNVTLTGIAVTDGFFSPALNCTIGSLVPNATDSTTCTASYTVDQDDLDKGEITNTATTSASSAQGSLTPIDSTAIIAAEPEVASLTIEKVEADANGAFGDVTTSEGYDFTITNTGLVTLTNIAIDDPLTGLSCTVADLAPSASTNTCDGGPAFASAYTIQQSDVDRGSLTNVVTVTAATTQGTLLEETDELVLPGPQQAPALTLVKSSTAGAGFSTVGESLTYEYIVTNSGNITLTEAITIDDDRVTVSCPSLPATGLAPNDSITCTATDTVDQSDLDAGEVENNATAKIQQTVVPSPLYPTGNAVVESNEETVTVTGTQTPSLSITKLVQSGSLSTYGALSDEIVFEFTVTNTGNVTTTGQIVVDDSVLGESVDCGPVAGGIAPGGTAVCAVTWSPAQGDIDAGSFTNSATASMPYAGGTVGTDPLAPAEVTVYAVQQPEMTVEKTYRDGSLANFAVGETATYDYAVTNTGNQTLVGPITIEDNLISAVDCASFTGDLAPGGTMSCVGMYTVGVTDVQLGSAVNVAKGVSPTVESETTSEIIPAGGVPALTITKVADVATFSAAGDKIVYTYDVTNTSTGSPAPGFANPIYIVDDKFATPIACWATSGADPDVQPGETVSCTAEYTVTQADMDAVRTDGSGATVSSFVKNTANGKTEFLGVDENGVPATDPVDVVSAPVTVRVDGAQDASLSLVKSASGPHDPAVVGDTVTFEITVTNDGEQTVSGIVVSDPMLSGLSCEVGGAAAPANVVLAPGGVVICEGTYDVAQSDVDAQVLENTASVAGSDPAGGPVTATGSTTYDVDPIAADVAVTKSLASGTPSAAYATVGQNVTYLIAVENTGNVTLASSVVTDILFPGQSCEITDLAPGVTDDSSCAFTYVVQQSDIDAGSIDNSVTVVAQPATPGSAPVDDSDTLEVFGPVRAPSVGVEKTASVAGFTAPDVAITYTYVVTNTGNITLTAAPVVVDDKIVAPNAVSCAAMPAGGLAPNGTLTCSAVYTTTQDDVDAGSVTNTVDVSVANPLGGAPLTATDDLTIAATRAPELTVSKVADDVSDVVAGQTVTYTYVVTNAGNTRLTDVTLSDAHRHAGGTTGLVIANNVIAVLEPGAQETRSASYVVTQADIDAGVDLTNTVTATGTPPAGAATPVPATADEVVSVAAEAPALETVKLAAALGANPGVGTSVDFTVSVENTGNVTLSDVTLVDTLKRVDNTAISPNPVAVYDSGDAGLAGQLDVGETWTYLVSHVLTQADIDAGGIVNSVRATGTSPGDTDVSDLSNNSAGAGSAPTVVLIAADPSLETSKRITDGPVTVGSTVRFEIDVENTGNVSLSDLTVSDEGLKRADGTALTLSGGPGFLRATLGSSAGDLQVGEVATYRASYVLTQADIDAGGIENSARATGTPPTGTPVTDATNTPVTLTIAPAPSIALVKSLTAGGPTFNAVGNVLTYGFVVTNTGNVTITEQVGISDPLITDAGGTIICAAPPLAPNATLSCEGQYTVTQADIDAGKVDNVAQANAGSVSSAQATETVPALQRPALATVKTGATITVDGTVYTDLRSEYFVTNAVVGYTYVVTNTGNLTLTDPITVADNRIANVNCPALPAAGLLPTQSITCTADYTVTETDVRLTSVTNAARATSGSVSAPIVTETVPADGEPLLSIEKTLSRATRADGTPIAGDTFDTVGDLLVYEFTVTNDGTISFVNDVVVEDARLASPLVCFTSTSADPGLRPTESVTCEGTYAVTQEDLDAGEVFNEAYAQTHFGADDTPVISDPDTVTTPSNALPALNIVKSAQTLPITGVGQVLTYTLTLSNDGNQTLTNVRATDPLIPTMSCAIPVLATGAVETCSGTYTVKQADIDAGELVNTAAARGLTPNGTAVGSETELVLDVPAAAPALVMTKVGNPQPFGPVGSAVTYVFTLENTGNVTLFDLDITDEIADPTFTCRVPRLDVGAVSDECALSYVVTQADVDAGEIVNVAAVIGRDPFNPIEEVTARSVIPSQPAMPSLEATKIANVQGTVVGSRVLFDLYVENTGDVSLDITGITDTMSLRNQTATALTSDFTYVSGDSDADGQLDVTETWLYQGFKTIDQADIDAGGFNNTVSVRATDPFRTPVTDQSDDGNDTDGNTTSDETEVPLVAGPALNVVKTILTGGAVAGDVVTFQIAATNIGNVTLTDLVIADEMRRADGTDVTADITSITQTSPVGGATEMLPNDIWTWTVSYTLAQADVDAGGLINTATATGTPPSGRNVTDRSDNGIDNDGNTVDDETVLAITASPDFEVVKTVQPRADASTPVLAGEVVTFEIAVNNNGNVTLTDLVLDDTMTNADGTVLTPDSITLTQGASDTEVMVGETLVFTVAYTLTQDDIDTGGIANTATASVVAPSGVPLVGVSDDGDDTDGNTLDDPTEFPIEQFSAMEISKEADVPVRIGTDLFEVVFTITVQNTGNVSQRDLVILDDLAPFVQPARLSGSQTVIASGFAGTGGANPTYNGISETNLVTSDVHLLPGDEGVITLTVTYDTSGSNHPEGLNTVVATSDRMTAGIMASVAIIGTADQDIVATKTATPSDVMLGTTVTYTLTFENRLDTAESNLTIIDDMPAGVIYTPDTARYNGSQTPAPSVTGRQLRWSGVSLAPREVVTITFDARVVGERGEMVNRAYMIDADGNVITNVATATVTRRPEAVFECSDIIGRVFDDRNMNGYQDGAVAPDKSAVTDQTYAGGKGGKLSPIPEVDSGSPFEPGLANVRLATVNGTIITTDEYGRFSVPCAELPAAIGSNFTLKLDERSLPTGYRVTTENPRVVRVTAGTVAKLNFGAAISNVVDIDLMASAFQTGTASPTAALVAGVDSLVRQLRDVPSVLRLSYYMNGEGRALARNRLDAVEELVRNRWRDNGRYRLLIERTIRQLQ